MLILVRKSNVKNESFLMSILLRKSKVKEGILDNVNLIQKKSE
jgi:hypothetical protein